MKKGKLGSVYISVEREGPLLKRVRGVLAFDEHGHPVEDWSGKPITFSLKEDDMLKFLILMGLTNDYHELDKEKIFLVDEATLGELRAKTQVRR